MLEIFDSGFWGIFHSFTTWIFTQLFGVYVTVRGTGVKERKEAGSPDTLYTRTEINDGRHRWRTMISSVATTLIEIPIIVYTTGSSSIPRNVYDCFQISPRYAYVASFHASKIQSSGGCWLRPSTTTCNMVLEFGVNVKYVILRKIARIRAAKVYRGTGGTTMEIVSEGVVLSPTRAYWNLKFIPSIFRHQKLLCLSDN